MGLSEEMLHICKSCRTEWDIKVSDSSEEEYRVTKIMLPTHDWMAQYFDRIYSYYLFTRGQQQIKV